MKARLLTLILAASVLAALTGRADTNVVRELKVLGLITQLQTNTVILQGSSASFYNGLFTWTNGAYRRGSISFITNRGTHWSIDRVAGPTTDSFTNLTLLGRYWTNTLTGVTGFPVAGFPLSTSDFSNAIHAAKMLYGPFNAGVIAASNMVPSDWALAIAPPGAGTVGATELAGTGVTPGEYMNPTLTLDADGRILVAANGTGGGGTPTVKGARAYLTTPQVLSDYDTDEQVMFDAESYDTDSAFDLGTGVFTCPVAGKYQVTVSIQYGVGSGAGSPSFLRFSCAAGPSSYIDAYGVETAGASTTLTETDVVTCGVSDTIGPVTVAVADDDTGAKDGSRITITYLGP